MASLMASLISGAMAHASPERSDGLSDGVPHQVTIAPERPGAMACIKELVAQGVVVSAGHSNASADQVRWPLIASDCLRLPLIASNCL
jgi:N-acetylglucosamine-6-phosphate deacetylase